MPQTPHLGLRKDTGRRGTRPGLCKSQPRSPPPARARLAACLNASSSNLLPAEANVDSPLRRMCRSRTLALRASRASRASRVLNAYAAGIFVRGAAQLPERAAEPPWHHGAMAPWRHGTMAAQTPRGLTVVVVLACSFRDFHQIHEGSRCARRAIKAD